MEIRKYYVYDQLNSGGIFYDTTECFRKGLHILPCNTVYFYDKCKSKYHNIAVIDKLIIPTMVYFDGVEEEIDCECCGDRWIRFSEWDEKEKVFIFNKRSEFEEALKNNELERYTHYTILEDFKGVE